MNIFEKIKREIVLRKISSYKEIEGWLTKNEAYGLFKYSSLVPNNGLVVEIGSWKGKSTYCLAKGLSKGKIFAIDPFDASGETGSDKIYLEQRGKTPLLDQFNDKMKSLGVSDTIIAKVGCSDKFLNDFEKIDFLFIDGDHSIKGCDFDFNNYSSKIVNGGYIVFHDYFGDRNDLGPTWVVKNRLIGNENYQFIGLYDSLWVAKKVCNN